MASAAAEVRPASEVMRELMRNHILKRRRVQDWDEYLQHKVEAGGALAHAGRGRENGEIETAFAVKRQQVANRTAR